MDRHRRRQKEEQNTQYILVWTERKGERKREEKETKQTTREVEAV